MTSIEITKQTWFRLVEAAREKGGPQIPVWMALTRYYNVCVESLPDSLSRSIFELWCRLGGTANESYESFWNLPAVYVAGCDRIREELQRQKEAAK